MKPTCPRHCACAVGCPALSDPGKPSGGRAFSIMFCITIWCIWAFCISIISTMSGWGHTQSTYKGHVMNCQSSTMVSIQSLHYVYTLFNAAAMLGLRGRGMVGLKGRGMVAHRQLLYGYLLNECGLMLANLQKRETERESNIYDGVIQQTRLPLC